MSRAQRRLDIKLLSNQCGLAKTLFQRKYQDTHSCPVCSVPFVEDRDHLYTCPDAGANKVFKKGIDKLEKILDEKETAPDIQKAIIGSLDYMIYEYAISLTNTILAKHTLDVDFLSKVASSVPTLSI